MNLADTPAWRDLNEHQQQCAGLHLRTLFAEDPERFRRFSLQSGGLLLDFSKQRITQTTLGLLHQLAKTAGIETWKQRMLAGEPINHTEQRAVRHMELRAGEMAPREVKQVLERMRHFCEAVHDAAWRGYTNERITHVVNIGIGGSDLGPRMVTRALLAHQHPDLEVHFVSNIDGADIAPLLARLNPRSTLFIVASKTFTTLETLSNARTARDWLLAAANDPQAIAKHFVAVSTNLTATREFGIPAENVFEFWDWVGGRFSLWSAIGLPIALAIGWSGFEKLLSGAQAMDHHFLAADDTENLPLTLALLSLWNTDFLGANTAAVLPYAQSFQFLPAYLQQLEMESNGKQTNRAGEALTVPSSPILWGEAGTNGQHSFFQLFHQGGRLIPCDFIALREADFPLPGHHLALLANCFAQSAALAFGQTRDEAIANGAPESLVPYKVFPGNQPSSTLLLPALTPYVLGQLIALFEHKTFCLGVLWNINSFDQWGVELGKQLASRLTSVLEGETSGTDLDSSTRGLIAAVTTQNQAAEKIQ